jgi:hypothetical protein
VLHAAVPPKQSATISPVRAHPLAASVTAVDPCGEAAVVPGARC